MDEQPYDDRHREPSVYVDPDVNTACVAPVNCPAHKRSQELSFHWPNGFVSPALGRAVASDLRSIDTVDLMTLQAHLERAMSTVRRAIEADYRQ